ncbi:MAG: DUF5329 domain-containing protein [Proteobacteria bacterium]|nr:DUF5329 domain-containing protein [Pseudomonadota bacterium]
MKILLITSIILMISSSAWAGSSMQKEINYLINFVLNSDCLFIRNGSEHTPEEAVAHIKKKYAYFESDINSAEKFIELSASKSTFSRKAYQIQCRGSGKIPSQKWLLDELSKYRIK